MIKPVKDTNEEYHAKKDFISSSNIAGIRTLKEYYYNKFVKEYEQKDYFDIGTAAHAYVLEPELFKNDVIVFKDSDFPEEIKRNADGTVYKKGKNGTALKTFKLNNLDKIVFEESIYNEVVTFAESFKQFPSFEKLFDLKTGHTEMSYYGKCQFTGLETKIRPDYVKPGVFIGDLKFERDISYHSICRSFSDYEYHVRAAFIIDNYNHFTGENIDTFIFAFAEKKAPYQVRIMNLSKLDLARGREIYVKRLEAIKKAMASKKWSGFEKETGAESLQSLVLPEWIYKDNDNNTNF